MGIIHTEEVPSSFSEAFSGKYLGDPDVVSALIGEFSAKYEEAFNALRAGSDKKEFADAANKLVRDYGDIFTGRNPEYKIIAGYHDNTLGVKLRADLGAFWQSHRVKWNDDAVCVLLEWLAVIMSENLKKADGDDMLFEVMMKPSVQYAVKVIVGIEARQ